MIHSFCNALTARSTLSWTLPSCICWMWFNCVLTLQRVFSNPVLSQIMLVFNQRVLIVHMGRMILNVQLKISPSQWPNQPQETAAHDRLANRPVTLSMPPPAQMMTSLKTVAEAVISLLTMLLKFLINQLETVPEGPENSPEVMQAMEGMVLELQNQRTMLQSLMTSAQNALPRRPKVQLEIQLPEKALRNNWHPDSLPHEFQRHLQKLLHCRWHH